MLESFKAFLARFGGSTPAKDVAPDETALSALALAMAVIRADGLIELKEEQTLEDQIRQHYDLDHAGFEALRNAALKADADSTDHYRFASHLRRHLDESAREAFVAMLWTLVRSDGHLNEMEGHMVYRIAEMIGVSGRERARHVVPADDGTEIAAGDHT